MNLLLAKEAKNFASCQGSHLLNTWIYKKKTVSNEFKLPIIFE